MVMTTAARVANSRAWAVCLAGVSFAGLAEEEPEGDERGGGRAGRGRRLAGCTRRGRWPGRWGRRGARRARPARRVRARIRRSTWGREPEGGGAVDGEGQAEDDVAVVAARKNGRRTSQRLGRRLMK